MLQAAALAPVVGTGESEDVGTRVRLHCDSSRLCRAQIWRSGTHARKQCEIWAQNLGHTLRNRALSLSSRAWLSPLDNVILLFSGCLATVVRDYGAYFIVTHYTTRHTLSLFSHQFSRIENSVKYGLNFNQTPYYYEYNLLEWVVGVVESTFAKNAHLSFCVLRRLDLLVSEDEVREVRVP